MEWDNVRAKNDRGGCADDERGDVNGCRKLAFPVEQVINPRPEYDRKGGALPPQPKDGAQFKFSECERNQHGQ